MTFLELEKKCKKRRVKKALLLLFSVLSIFLAVTGSFFLFKDTKNENKSDIKKLKTEPLLMVADKNHSKKKRSFIEKNTTKIKKTPPKLKLVIDLNLSEIKEETKDEIKKVKSLKKSDIKQKEILTSNVLPSYQTCISLSEKYLKEGKYKDALKWAKYANLQDRKKPDSWILSAQALYKMGKKEQALKILKIYYNYYPDKKVKELIGKLSEKDNN